LRPREEVEQVWSDDPRRPEHIDSAAWTVWFSDAPGDRGTEIHVELAKSAPAGKLGEAVQKVLGTEPLAKAKDDLRRFKQLLETGEVTRSEAAPEGEQLERKLRKRPAQPLARAELDKVGA
jgi:thioredoxin-like negative regulator of GroEL